MTTKKEILKKVEEVLDIIDYTSGYAGLQEFQNSSLPEFINWYEDNIQYCSPDAEAEGQKVVDLLKAIVS
jgi:hypothetical protein